MKVKDFIFCTPSTWAVAIVDKGYLMNNFLKKDEYQLLKTWTNREITT